MTQAFADTFYYLALYNRQDAAHEAAKDFSASFRGTLVTTWGVLLEIGDALCREANRPSALQLLDLIRDDPATEVVPLDDELLTSGIELFRARLDKDWSLTDCISFEVMRDLGLSDAVTGDRHFKQAGFKLLLPEAGE
jgi:predicted nucleic acid-binding protein